MNLINAIDLYAGHFFRGYTRKFNKEWDDILSGWLDSDIPYELKKRTIKFNFPNGETAEVWIANRWFSYGWCYDINGDTPLFEFRPSLKTMARLHMIDKATYPSRLENFICKLKSVGNQE